MEYTFGQILKELRLEKNLTQIELAKQLDVGKATISEWENNIYEPNLSKLKIIAQFFGVSIDYLAGLED